MYSSIAFQRRAKKILPSQLERAIGLKLAGLSIGPDGCGKVESPRTARTEAPSMTSKLV